MLYLAFLFLSTDFCHQNSTGVTAVLVYMDVKMGFIKEEPEPEPCREKEEETEALIGW